MPTKHRNLDWYWDDDNIEEWDGYYADYPIKYVLADWQSDITEHNKQWQAKLREEQFKVLLWERLMQRWYDGSNSFNKTMTLYRFVMSILHDNPTPRLPTAEH